MAKRERRMQDNLNELEEDSKTLLDQSAERLKRIEQLEKEKLECAQQLQDVKARLDTTDRQMAKIVQLVGTLKTCFNESMPQQNQEDLFVKTLEDVPTLLQHQNIENYIILDHR